MQCLGLEEGSVAGLGEGLVFDLIKYKISLFVGCSGHGFEEGSLSGFMCG